MKSIYSVFLFAAALACAHAVCAHEGSHQNPRGAQVAKVQQAWGIAGDPNKARRSIAILMDDRMRFTPDKLELRQGETVRLILKNQGKLLHEMVIGTKAVLDEHAALMARFPGMEHDEPYMAHVAPGKTGTIIWTFNKAGEFDFACLIAGHYQAGMVGKILVRPR